MEFHLWLSLVIICCLGAMSPGPSLALVIKNTMNGGKAQGYATAISHGIGVALYAAITATGIGFIIVNTPFIFTFIQYAGAAFLGYLGIKALITSMQKPTIEQQESTISTTNGWRDGFLIAFLNPKLAIFFLALFSQFVNANAFWQEKVIMTATAGLIDTFWYIFVTFAISRGTMIERLKKHRRIIDGITGVLLIFIAIRVVFVVN